MRRIVRVTGTVLAAAGVCLGLWALTVWLWQDPFTALYTTTQQHRLAGAYEQAVASYRPPPHPSGSRRASPQSVVERAARRFRHRLETGDAVGRLRIPRLGLNAVVVDGTDHASLAKGPGLYRGAFVPGEGGLVYIAGHRTTYGAPFAFINHLRRGDPVTLEMPYATFTYRVRGSVIVPANDVARLRSRGREVIALQACHPRFFATHRFIVYADPVRVVPREGRAYLVRRPGARA